jgi:RNA polymerase sigma-70 factor (ECF subfamily)
VNDLRSPPDVTASIDLVRRAQDGEPDALGRLCERYYERVRRIVRVRLGQGLRGAMDSGDVLQETFAAAVKDFERFEVRDEGGLIHWLARIAENRIRAAARHARADKRDRGREVPLDDGSPSAPVSLEPHARELSPLDAMAEAEQAALIEAALAALPEERREVIVLREWAGATWETVAALTGRPSPGSARMLHARAMLQLAALLRGEPRSD